MSRSHAAPRLTLWALLIAVAYGPSSLIGAAPGATTVIVLGLAVVLAGAVALAARTPLLERAAIRIEPLAGRLLAVVVLGYVILSSARSAARLAAFADYNQLGIFNQSFWTLLHGHAFANTHETVDGSLGSHFGIHFSPTLLLILPFYALWPRPLVLLMAQALAIGLLTVPLYHLLKREAGPAGALALAVATLAVPNFAWAGIRDFHDASFLPVFLVTALWALERRRIWPMLIAVLLALGVREDIGLTVALLGVYAGLRGNGWRIGLGIAALGLIWSAVAIRGVMPLFWSPGLWVDPARFFVDALGHWGPTPLQALAAMFMDPARLGHALVNQGTVHYLYGLLSPLLLVPPLLHPVALVAAPGVAMNMLSRYPWGRIATSYYSIVPLTFLAIATVKTAARLASSAPGAGWRAQDDEPEGRAAAPGRAAIGLAAGLIVLLGVLPSLPTTSVVREPPAPPASAAAAVVRAIPAGVPVYGPVTLYPPLGNRENYGCWWSTGPIAREPAFRSRYAWIVLWPAGDPPDSLRDAPLADSLAHDRRFSAVPGFEPLLVYRRR